MAAKKFGWCFIGSGSITKRVLADFDKTDGGYLASVYSRTFERAKALADEYDATAYASAEAAMTAPGVRAVYVATPHPKHVQYALMALNLGIPVLCEKPLAMDYAGAEAMINLARAKGVFFMEGMWMRFNPVIERTLSWIGAGLIGPLQTMTASFTSRVAYDESSRLYNEALGGGALLDVGIYTLALARFVTGRQPAAIQTAATFAKSGADDKTSVVLEYDGGFIARLFSGLSVYEPQDGYIYGADGYIHLPKFWAPKTVRHVWGAKEEIFDAEFEGEGFQFEFNAVMRDIWEGRTEDARMPHALSLEIMRTAEDCLRKFEEK
jgi:predicted dehydrogenase